MPEDPAASHPWREPAQAAEALGAGSDDSGGGVLVGCRDNSPCRLLLVPKGSRKAQEASRAVRTNERASGSRRCRVMWENGRLSLRGPLLRPNLIKDDAQGAGRRPVVLAGIATGNVMWQLSVPGDDAQVDQATLSPIDSIRVGHPVLLSRSAEP
jgi:hypothetical protein